MIGLAIFLILVGLAVAVAVNPILGILLTFFGAAWLILVLAGKGTAAVVRATNSAIKDSDKE